MSEVDQLLSHYEDILKLPWGNSLSGAEKVWFVVYDPSNERRIRLRIPEFELRTIQNSYEWKQIDISDSFAEWLSKLEYRESFFENPKDMDPVLQEYEEFIIDRILSELLSSNENTIVALIGISSLFGLTHASKIIENINSKIIGRLLVFFPGRYDGSVYRLLDARDGWNYLAVPITAG